MQILEGKKKVFTETEAPVVIIEHFNELKVSNVLSAVLPNQTIESYLPNKGSKQYAVDQPFVLRVVKKLEPDYFTKIVEAARSAHREENPLKDRTDTITMNKTVYDKLMLKPFNSRKLQFWI